MNGCLPFVNAIVTLPHCIYLMQSLHHNLLDLCKYLMMQSSLWKMVCTRTSEEHLLYFPESSAGCGYGQARCGNAPPQLLPHPPVSLDQLLTMENDLMRRLVENDERRGAELQPHRHKDRDFSYSNFLATNPSVFADVVDNLDAGS
jgi:hypothetical protein